MLVIEKTKFLKSIQAAFYIGAVGGESEIIPDLLSEFNQTRTMAARTARRANAVQTIIEDATQDLWAKLPAKRGKLSDTARAIAKSVKAKLAETEDLPPDWQPNAWGNDKQMIDRIRKRVQRIARPDNRQSSKKKAG